jgi:hypothetical protein
MDPEANIKEQERIAKEIQAITDNCDGQGNFTKEQTELLIHFADELAELVLALIEWKRKGGF